MMPPQKLFFCLAREHESRGPQHQITHFRYILGRGGGATGLHLFFFVFPPNLANLHMVLKVSSQDDVFWLTISLIPGSIPAFTQYTHNVVLFLLSLMSIIKFLIEIIMSWNMSIAVMNKLSLWTRMLFSKSRDLLVWLIGAYYSCKARCIRWYYGIRTLGVKEFFFGSGRPAQTYNLPNSGI